MNIIIFSYHPNSVNIKRLPLTFVLKKYSGAFFQLKFTCSF